MPGHLVLAPSGGEDQHRRVKHRQRDKPLHPEERGLVDRLMSSDAHADVERQLGEMVTQIDRRVRHHLGRARAVAPDGNPRARTPLAAAIADLASALERIHAERAIAATVAIAAGLAVAVDP